MDVIKLTLVIHIFVPFNTQPPSTSLAVVFILTTSEPAECSDIARAPILSPERRPGRNRSFCSGLPFKESWFTQSWEWAAYDSAMLPEVGRKGSSTSEKKKPLDNLGRNT